jgi:tellurium resistance protein TerZ
MAIKLKKGGKISLAKGDGNGLRVVKIGLAWDPIKKESGGIFGMFKSTSMEAVDLDASCVIRQNGSFQNNAVYFGNLRAFGGAIQHSGDNLTGEGDGDDETIVVDLTKLPDSVDQLTFTISSFRGQTFSKIQTAYCHIRDESGAILAEFDMAGGVDKTGIVVGTVTRTGNVWEFEAVGEYKNGRTFKELVG